MSSKNSDLNPWLSGYLFFNHSPLDISISRFSTADFNFRQISKARQLPHRNHTDRHMIIDGMTDMFALAAAHTNLGRYLKPHGRKVHCQGIHGTLRHAGMAPLPGRAQSLRHLRHAEVNLRDPINRLQRVSRTRGNTGEVVTEETGRLVRENHRSPVAGMTHNRARIAGFDAVAAFGTAIQEYRFIHGARRPQPIRPQPRSGRLRDGIGLPGKLLRRLGDRQH
ncbi:MAG: hypothetical protein RL768_1386 [Nitrospirota bacterium]|jgi:hypothetical protein